MSKVKVLNNCFQLFLPLTIFENNQVRILNNNEIKYKNNIIDKIADKFGGVTLEHKEGKYKRAEGIVDTNNEIVTVYTDNYSEAFDFLEEIIYDIKHTLHQDSVAIIAKGSNTDSMFLM